MDENQQESDFNANVDDIFKKAWDNAEEEVKEQPIMVDFNKNEDNPSIIVEEENRQNVSPSMPSEEEYHREINIKKKLSSIQREKNRLAAENKQLAEEAIRAHQEAEVLRSQMETSANAAMFHYENKLNLEENGLQESLQKAIDMSDGHEVAKITGRIAELRSDKKEMERRRIEDAYRQQQMQYSQPQYPPLEYRQPFEQEPEINPLQEYWINQNSWISEESPDYNPQKVEVARDFAERFENDLINNGYQHLINTPYYYQEVDKFLKNQSPQDNGNKMNSNKLSMNSSRSSVAPVRRSSNGSYDNSGNPDRISLNSDALAMAKSLGLTKEQFGRSMLDLQKRDSEAMQRGDLGYLKSHGYLK